MAGLDSYTKLLLHCDGVDASTSFPDAMVRHTQTANANAQVDTAQYKFGTASMLLDGNADYVSTAGNTSDFAVAAGGEVTIDFQYKHISYDVANARFFNHGADTSFGCYLNGTSPNFYINAGAAAATKATSVVDGSWHHIACVAWLDGAQRKIGLAVDGTFGTWLNDVNSCVADNLWIGENTGGGRALHGWIDEFRVSNTARWKANFTAPTAQYTAAGRSGGYIII